MTNSIIATFLSKTTESELKHKGPKLLCIVALTPLSFRVDSEPKLHIYKIPVL